MSKAFYDDPFFNDDFFNNNFYHQSVGHFFDEFNNRFQQMNNYFDKLFNSAFQIKPAIEDQKAKQSSNSKEAGDHSSKNTNESNSKQIDSPTKPNITETQAPQQEYFYSSRFSSYSDSSGIGHTKCKVSDNIHGTQMTETRRIGDRSITWKRVIGKEGSIKDKETRHNIGENEKDKFAQEWGEKSPKNKYFEASDNKNLEHSDQVAIQ
jgi:hypothetical protein